MAQTLIKGKVRKALNKILKMSTCEFYYYSLCTLPVNVTNVRMYIDNERWARYKYRFEVDVEITVPTYKGSPSTLRYSDNRYIASTLRRRFPYQSNEIEKKCRMFSGNDGNTEVVFKKISIIRNNIPPSLENS